jgi:hypothetical protein
MYIDDLVEEVRSRLRAIQRQVERPAILLTGSKESCVLHWIADKTIGRVIFYDEIQPERRKFLEDLYIQSEEKYSVLNYLPQFRTFYADEKGTLLRMLFDVKQQGLLEHTLEVVPGNYCLFDWLTLPTRDCPDLCFDSFFRGYGQECEIIGGVRVYNGLLRWSEQDVWEALKHYDIPYDKERDDHSGTCHLDALATCTNCLSSEKYVPCPKYGGKVRAEDIRTLFRSTLCRH